jgi:hypothetical protein
MGNGNNSTMMIAVSSMMSMMACMFIVPISIAIAVWIYREYFKDDEYSATGKDLTRDPGEVDDHCVVIMNNAPDDNPEGKTKRICLKTGENSRQIDLKQEMKEFHDEVSAARIGKGLFLDFYEHAAYGGKKMRIDGDETSFVDLTTKCINGGESGNCTDGGPDWNDDLSSLEIIRKT